MNADERFLEYLRHLREEELRAFVLMPLLRRMGYRDVVEYHGGSAEKGKDIVCWYSDPSGERRFVSLVVKRGNIHGSVSKSGNAAEVLHQLQQVFDEPYTDLYGLKEVIIDECWVVASGDILNTAVESIQGQLKKSNLNKFVRFLDSSKVLGLINNYYPEFRLQDFHMSLFFHEVGARVVCAQAATERLEWLLANRSLNDDSARRCVEDILSGREPSCSADRHGLS